MVKKRTDLRRARRSRPRAQDVSTRVTFYINPLRNAVEERILPFIEGWRAEGRGVLQRHMIAAVMAYVASDQKILLDDPATFDVERLGDRLLDYVREHLPETRSGAVYAAHSTRWVESDLLAVLSESANQVYDEEGDDGAW